MAPLSAGILPREIQRKVCRSITRRGRGPVPHGVEVIFAVIRRRNRKRSDGTDAVVRSDAVAIRALATW
jgi:hypothetical protein